MNFFKKMQKQPPDPIFGLQQAFIEDPRPEKINLGIGSYKDENLRPKIFTSVKKAEEKIWKEETQKEYLPISGFVPFIEAVKELVFKGREKELIAAVQSVGGTGALRLGGELLYRQGYRKVVIPNLTWDNHRRLFEAVGFQVESYPYYNYRDHSLNLEALLAFFNTLPEETVVILQSCCHNPTGLDPTLNEWQEIASVVKQRNIFPFFDFAYQGFGEGLSQDAGALSLFSQQEIPLLVASSFSKNFGLYAERVGALLVPSFNKEEAEKIESNLKVIIRTLYSNPPSHGAKILACIWKDSDLYREWDSELSQIRERLHTMRNQLLHSIRERLHSDQFDFIARQKGMFSYLGLSEEQVEKLKQERAIYLVKGGRINVSGMNEKIIPKIADAIVNTIRPIL